MQVCSQAYISTLHIYSYIYYITYIVYAYIVLYIVHLDKNDVKIYICRNYFKVSEFVYLTSLSLVLALFTPSYLLSKASGMGLFIENVYAHTHPHSFHDTPCPVLRVVQNGRSVSPQTDAREERNGMRPKGNSGN